MRRRYVNQLSQQERIKEVFRASEKQLRPNRNGNLYLQVDLSDRSGTIGRTDVERHGGGLPSFENGDYVRVEGTTQLFQGNLQLILARIASSSPARSTRTISPLWRPWKSTS